MTKVGEHTCEESQTEEKEKLEADVKKGEADEEKEGEKLEADVKKGEADEE